MDESSGFSKEGILFTPISNYSRVIEETHDNTSLKTKDWKLTPMKKLLQDDTFITPKAEKTMTLQYRTETDLSIVKAAELDSTERHEDPNVPFLKWCAFCAREVPVQAVFRNSKKTLWSSVVIFMLGGVFGCFLLPYMNNHFKDLSFFCTQCNRKINLS